MIILVLNCGSSSIKYQLFNMGETEEVIAKGIVEAAGPVLCALWSFTPGEMALPDTIEETLSGKACNLIRSGEVLRVEQRATEKEATPSEKLPVDPIIEPEPQKTHTP